VEERLMAHTCPDCGQVCYCNGDIDDCLNEFEEDVINCNHWMQCEKESDDDFYAVDEEGEFA
jgi:hypothetical protein